jgi:hypothetical protein
MEDFSKCQCPKAGWCDLLKKEMTANPPNWQWCQGLTEEARKKYYESINSNPRTFREAVRNGTVSLINFVDKLPDRNSNHAVCVIPATDDMLELLEITRPSIKAYAEKCGADYVELTGNQQPDWPMGNKYRVHNVSTVYEKTLYLDCDIIINDHAPNIFDLTPDDKLSIYEEWSDWVGRDSIDWIKKEQEIILRKFLSQEVASKFLVNGRFDGGKMLNGGVMVIPKSVADWYQQPSVPYPRQWCFDQNYLSFILPDELHHNLDQRFNLTWQAMHKWDCFTSPLLEWMERAKDAYFLHVNGERNITVRHHVLNLDLKDETRVKLSNHELVSSTSSNEWLYCKEAKENQDKINLKIRSYVSSQEDSNININKDVSIALVGHNKDQWDTIERKPFLKILDLNCIDGEYSGNEWAESRAYLLEDFFPDEAKFVGFVTASWNTKYSKLKPIHNLPDWPESKILFNSDPEDKVYLCADMYCTCGWTRYYSPNRRGIITDIFGHDKYPRTNEALIDLLESIDLPFETDHRPIPFSNQGIYHRSIYDAWIKFLKDKDVFSNVKRVAEEHDLLEVGGWSNRPYAYFIEAVNCFWCQNQDFKYIGTTTRNHEWYDDHIRTKRGW